MSHHKSLFKQSEDSSSLSSYRAASRKKIAPTNEWMNVSSPNSLPCVHFLHVGGGGGGGERKVMDKTLRDVFVSGNVQDIRDNFQVLAKVLPKGCWRWWSQKPRKSGILSTTDKSV